MAKCFREVKTRMHPTLQIRGFSMVDLNDPFFDSLKVDYAEFSVWFQRKAAQSTEAWTMTDATGRLQAFLYMKVEDGVVADVEPPFLPKRRLKIGTMKIVAHGTRLGERLMKKVMDVALAESVDEVDVTVFAKHTGLIALYTRYGFRDVGTKSSSNGVERVLVKDFHASQGDVLAVYPRIALARARIHLLAIYPEYHTRLFPDSILKTEPFDVIHDVSHTNSIHKAYLSRMNVAGLRRGDVLVIYRTSDGKGPARYRSVVTSICVVEDVRPKSAFPTAEALWTYCGDYSVFSKPEIEEWYGRNGFSLIKMTYNAAFRKRLTRGYLMDEVGLSGDSYWGFLPLTVEQFHQICTAGEVHEGLVID